MAAFGEKVELKGTSEDETYTDEADTRYSPTCFFLDIPNHIMSRVKLQ
jgi:hypothetical protein